MRYVKRMGDYVEEQLISLEHECVYKRVVKENLQRSIKAYPTLLFRDLISYDKAEAFIMKVEHVPFEVYIVGDYSKPIQFWIYQHTNDYANVCVQSMDDAYDWIRKQVLKEKATNHP
ncbi:hypothetical protein [Metabacillus iocasae]|uniref:Uncharacterized protein n=1 Tax=Priestia iocasae TaxID=2291674 RepID=A0ABS2QYX5_9BACI|nr:hypothetical protein [Metabacillus iocasae]MBM7703906.1 hypothetical protein [Metabacillus iocasae]